MDYSEKVDRQLKRRACWSGWIVLTQSNHAECRITKLRMLLAEISCLGWSSKQTNKQTNQQTNLAASKLPTKK